MSFRTKFKVGIAFFILAILVAFLVLNRQPVDVNLIVGSLTVSSAVLIFAIFILGFLLGWIFHSIFKVKRPHLSSE